MSRWVWVPAVLYLGVMLWAYGPTAYDVYLKQAVENYYGAR